MQGLGCRKCALALEANEWVSASPTNSNISSNERNDVNAGSAPNAILQPPDDAPRRQQRQRSIDDNLTIVNTIRTMLVSEQPHASRQQTFTPKLWTTSYCCSWMPVWPDRPVCQCAFRCRSTDTTTTACEIMTATAVTTEVADEIEGGSTSTNCSDSFGLGGCRRRLVNICSYICAPHLRR